MFDLKFCLLLLLGLASPMLSLLSKPIALSVYLLVTIIFVILGYREYRTAKSNGGSVKELIYSMIVDVLIAIIAAALLIRLV